MKWKRIITRAISEVSALSRSLNSPHKDFRIIMYHSISKNVLNNLNKIIYVSPQLFEIHMAALSSYHKASVVKLTDRLTNDNSLKIAVTFDDGYKDNLFTAAPVLNKYCIPFTVFVSTSHVKNRNSDFLSPSELRELASIPHVTIGSHGVNHVPLTECDDRTLINELVSSKHYLEDLIGNQITTMSYPFGAVNTRVRNAAEKAGYTLGACSYFGINNASCDPLLLHRTEITGTDSGRVFIQKLRGDWDWYGWRKKPLTNYVPILPRKDQDKHPVVFDEKGNIMKPSVSINLCCYNSEKYLRETLQSIVNQTYKDWELVIINDGSSDSTESIIFEFKNQGYPIIYHYQENKGLGASRNKAIELSQGEYIAFIDHDDIWLPQKLEKQIPLFRRNPKVGLVFSNVIHFNNKGLQKKKLCGKGKFYRGKVFREILNNYFISMPTAVIKREALYNRSKWFDNRFKLIEETDLFIRIAHDWELDYVDEALALYRVHKDSSSWSKKELFPYEYEMMLEKYNHLYPELATHYQTELTKMRRYIQYQHALIDWEKGNKYKARKLIRPYIFTSKKYFAMYLLMHLPYYLFWKIKSYFYVMPD